MKTIDAQARVAELTAEIAKLKSSQGEAQQHCARLETERKPLRLAARRDGDAKAEEKLKALDRSLDEAQRKAEDLGALVAEHESELPAAQGELASAQFEDRRSRVRKLLARHISGESEQRLVDAVKNVRQICMELKAEYENAADELDRWEPYRLRTEIGRIRNLSQSQGELVGVQLEEIGVPLGLSYAFAALARQRDFVTNASLAFRSADVEVAVLDPKE